MVIFWETRFLVSNLLFFFLPFGSFFFKREPKSPSLGHICQTTKEGFMNFISNPKKVVVLLSALSVSFLLLANCRGHKDFEKRIEWVASKLNSKLDLDDNQKEKLNQIKAELIAKHKENKPEHMGFSKEIADQIRLEKIDPKVLDKIGSDREAKHAEMRKFFNLKLIEFHAVLRPDQREKLAELVLKFGKRHSPED